MNRKIVLFLIAFCMVISINVPVHADDDSTLAEPPLVQQFTHGIGGS